MKIVDTARAIQEALGLSEAPAEKLIDALDTRYKRVPPKVIESQMRLEQIGDVVVWRGKPHRIGKCADAATQCFACDRLGKHLEPIEEPSVVVAADLANPGITWSSSASSPCIPQSPKRSAKIVEHCLGNDCADKAACECMCEKCNPIQGDPT